MSSTARKRRGCRRRACCWAGPRPTGWSATSAARRWNWPRCTTAEVGRRVTSPLGPLKLQAFKGIEEGAARAYRRRSWRGWPDSIGRDNRRIFLVGGSWRAIARIDMLRRAYPLTVLHEYRMTPAAMCSATVDYIAKADLPRSARQTSTSMARLSLVPLASEVLRQLVRAFKPQRDRGLVLRHPRGHAVRADARRRCARRDPLIEACRFAETEGCPAAGLRQGALRRSSSRCFPGHDAGARRGS